MFKRWKALLAVAAVAVSCWAVTSMVLETNNAVQASCESGNIVREGLRETYELALEKSQTTQYDKFFPNIPQAILDNARKEEAEVLEYNINVRFAPRDC